MTLSRPGMRFESAGEYRLPRKGEWYRGLVGEAMADRDFDVLPREILKRTDAGERCQEELERLRLDEMERAAAAKERGQHLRRYQTEYVPPPKPVNDLRPVAETAEKVSERYLPYADSED